MPGGTPSFNAISLLKELKLEVVMLTGDNSYVANFVKDKLNIDKVYSNVLPIQKEEVIKELQLTKTVVMVGDGINDAIALTRADVGVSVSNGSDIANSCADIILMKNDLSDIYKAILLSKRTISNIKQNLFWALIYNILLIPIAAGVLYSFNIVLDPMFAAFAMAMSSTFVVCNALRVRYLKNNFIKKRESNMKITIKNMNCNHCKSSIEKELNNLNISHSIDLENKIVLINKEISNEEIHNIFDKIGFEIIKIEKM